MTDRQAIPTCGEYLCRSLPPSPGGLAQFGDERILDVDEAGVVARVDAELPVGERHRDAVE